MAFSPVLDNSGAISVSSKQKRFRKRYAGKENRETQKQSKITNFCAFKNIIYGHAILFYNLLVLT